MIQMLCIRMTICVIAHCSSASLYLYTGRTRTSYRHLACYAATIPVGQRNADGKSEAA